MKHIMSFMPQSTHILFLSFYYDSISEWCLFQIKALEGNILEYYLVKIVVEIGRALQCIDNNIADLY